MEKGEECAFFVDGETFLDLVYEPSEKYLKEIKHLEFFRKRGTPTYRDYYIFDIETEGERPAKFQKQQVYDVLESMIRYVNVNREYFYWYISTHTNLGYKASVKQVFARRAKTDSDFYVTSVWQNYLSQCSFCLTFATARSGLA